MRAMIVDDSRAQRMLLKRAVTPLGFEVIEAENGEDALAKLSPEEPVDVMLVDWNMPVMDGLALVRQVRANRAFADVFVMMVTSESDPKKMARALMVGADDYLVKPVDGEMIRSRLEQTSALTGRLA
jgi:two-component system, chemotaxis family, chemotaxis protein CheY